MVVQNFLANGGIHPEQTQHVTGLVLNLLNMLSTRFDAPPPAATAPSTQSLSQEPVVIPDEQKPDTEEAEEMEFTEGSTDSGAEAAAATANLPHTKIKKKVSKKDRGAKAGGKGSQSKGGASEIIKAADHVKTKKK